MKKKLVNTLLTVALVASYGNATLAASSTIEDLTSLRGNTAPTQDEIDLVNTTLNDTYLGDVFDTVIPNDYSGLLSIAIK